MEDSRDHGHEGEEQKEVKESTERVSSDQAEYPGSHEQQCEHEQHLFLLLPTGTDTSPSHGVVEFRIQRDRWQEACQPTLEARPKLGHPPGSIAATSFMTWRYMRAPEEEFGSPGTRRSRMSDGSPCRTYERLCNGYGASTFGPPTPDAPLRRRGCARPSPHDHSTSSCEVSAISTSHASPRWLRLLHFPGPGKKEGGDEGGDERNDVPGFGRSFEALLSTARSHPRRYSRSGTCRKPGRRKSRSRRS